MDADVIERIREAKELVEERNNTRVRLESRRDQLKADVTSYKERMRDRGIDPSRIDELLETAEKRLVDLLEELEAKLNGEQGKSETSP